MCLIFVGKGRRRKYFNDENFAIYGMLRHSLSKHTHDMFTSTYYKYYMILHTHTYPYHPKIWDGPGELGFTHTHTHSHQLIAYTKLITRSLLLCIYRPLDDLYSILKRRNDHPIVQNTAKGQTKALFGDTSIQSIPVINHNCLQFELCIWWAHTTCDQHTTIDCSTHVQSV